MLRWSHKWGTSISAWQKKYEEGGTPPPAFFERPEIWPHLHEIQSAFYDLGTERQIGMGLGPIPSSKIRDYALEQLDLDGDAAERFFTIVRSMDDEYLTLNNQATKPKTDSKLEREVSADDLEGTRDILRSVAARKKSQKK